MHAPPPPDFHTWTDIVDRGLIGFFVAPLPHWKRLNSAFLLPLLGIFSADALDDQLTRFQFIELNECSSDN